MSLTTVIALNAILDLALLGGLAWFMLLPFRSRPFRDEAAAAHLSEREELELAA